MEKLGLLCQVFGGFAHFLASGITLSIQSCSILDFTYFYFQKIQIGSSLAPQGKKKICHYNSEAVMINNLLLQPQGTFPYPIRVLVKVPYGVRSWQWEKCSSTFVTQEPFWSMCLGIVVLQCFSSSFSTLNSISLPVKWLEQICICLVARGCLLGCWFLLLSSSYFTVLQRDLLVFRSIYFSFSLQGMYGMFQPALLREKSQCGTESCSTECVHLQCWFSSQPAMGTISRFSLHFGGGVPKICPANVRYRVYVLS